MVKNKTLFGLPREVKFCKECVISNQRPITLVETKHIKDAKKKLLFLMRMEFVIRVSGQK